ncbi:hypothetical protein V8G54_022622 [Vigna mungo]|uniref:Uncharacterized protein n=1 Tax=Vigna mungo TaxID=3915 RepID=A0AAQ3RRT8_VIGMU
MSKVLEQSGVDLTGENKLICNKGNIIGKAILTCIGMKKTAHGWIFHRFKRTSKRVNDLNKSLSTLNEKMDILFKHFIEISSSSETSEREDVDDISEESTTETFCGLSQPTQI